MNLVVIIPYFYPANIYGGAVTASYNLTKKIAEKNVNVKVITTNINGKSKLNVIPNIFTKINNFQVKYYNKSIIPFFSFKMIFSLAKDIKQADIIHIQSIYSLSTPFALIHSYIQKKATLLSPRGSFCSYSFKHRGFIKKIWINFLIKPFVKKIYFHATSDKEEKEIKFFFPDAKVEIISDGINLDKKHTEIECNEKWKNSFYLACLGRIHKIKGYDIILNSMPKIVKHIPNLKLFIAGMDEGELSNLMKLTKILKIEENVEFVGPLNSNNKNCFLKYAQCLIMPSHSENFGIVAAEALFQKTPVIASTNTPWSILECEQAGFHVKNTPDEICNSVLKLLNNIEFFVKNTDKVIKNLSWEIISNKYKNTLKKISNK